jgi:glycosyltransferase involved in cell wall biosynthesis
MHDLRALRPSRVTLAEFRRLLGRWDLAEPERSSRVRELFLATAGDGPFKRMRLAYDIVVPPRAQFPAGATGPFQTLRRVTLGTASRVAGKFGEHGEDHTGIEYDEVGEQEAGRERFIEAVTSLGGPRSTRTRIVVFSPSAAVGMSHYARALTGEMMQDADVTLIDGAEGGGVLSLRRKVAAAAKDPEAVLLVTSPHWSVPWIVQGGPRRGGFVFHDPILDAATPLTRWLHVLYYRILARRLGTIILHGQMFVRNVIALGLPARSVIVVPLGFVPNELEVDRTYDPRGPIAFLGRFHPYKGLGVFADAVRLLAAKGLEVPILAAGEGLPPNALPALPWVEVRRGEITDSEFREAIAACSAVVLPYERANQSSVLATAFRAGRPAIVSRVGSFPEYVRDGVNGLLVPPSDPAALAAAIERFRADPVSAARMAEAAHRTWAEELSPKRASEKIVRALSGSRPASRS